MLNKLFPSNVIIGQLEIYLNCIKFTVREALKCFMEPVFDNPQARAHPPFSHEADTNAPSTVNNLLGHSSAPKHPASFLQRSRARGFCQELPAPASVPLQRRDPPGCHRTARARLGPGAQREAARCQSLRAGKGQR